MVPFHVAIHFSPIAQGSKATTAHAYIKRFDPLQAAYGS